MHSLENFKRKTQTHTHSCEWCVGEVIHTPSTSLLLPPMADFDLLSSSCPLILERLRAPRVKAISDLSGCVLFFFYGQKLQRL